MRERDGRHCDRCGVLLTRKNNRCGFELCDTCNDALELEVMKIKALEQEPCKNGKWLGKDASGYRFYGKCSECGQEFCLSAWYTQNMKYCPNCGAKMAESEEE